MGLITKIFGTYSERELKSIWPIVHQIEGMEAEYKAMTDAQLQAKTPEFKERLANGETLDDILPEAFATVREACTSSPSTTIWPSVTLNGWARYTASWV